MDSAGDFIGNSPEFVELVFKPAQDMRQAVEEFVLACKELGKDACQCAKWFNVKPNDQCRRRALIRSVFVLLEGMAYGLKSVAYQNYVHYEVPFSAADIAILREERYTLEEKGETSTQPTNYQRFIPNLKFAFKSFAKSHGATFDVSMFKSALKDFEELRNRLTHPKKLADLTVTDQEIEVANRVWHWLLEQQGKLLPLAVNHPPLRMPQRVRTQFETSHPYVAVTPSGDIYGFPTRRQAEAYRRQHSGEGSPEKCCIVVHLADQAAPLT